MACFRANFTLCGLMFRLMLRARVQSGLLVHRTIVVIYINKIQQDATVRVLSQK